MQAGCDDSPPGFGPPMQALGFALVVVPEMAGLFNRPH
jgi:hypothetical protein